MPRIARIVVPGLAYHITHRGNHREDIFYRRQDRWVYKKWLRRYCARHRLEIWAYCLMTNHVHLIAVAKLPDALALAIGRTHWRFAQWQNLRNGWSGHLWANRYFSTPLDEQHLWAAARYVERNPVRAGLVARAELYEWSSARSHAMGKPDALLSSSRPFPGHIKNWSEWLTSPTDPKTLDALRKNTLTGRPSGSAAFVQELESELNRALGKPQRGRRTEARA